MAEFISLLILIKVFVVQLSKASEQPIRYAVATDGGTSIHRFPLSQECDALVHSEEFFDRPYPDYLTSQNGP